MDSVSASVAARAKELTEKQREFVRATASLAKSLGFSQMLRSQITMNAILLCRGAISRLLFLSFTGSRPEFQELLKGYEELFSQSNKQQWVPASESRKSDFCSRMAKAKIQKRHVCSHLNKLRETEESPVDAEPDTDGVNTVFFDKLPLPDWWRFLQKHYTTAKRNLESFEKTGDVHGFRYSDTELRRVYCLTSLTGKLMYNVMHRILGFPSWSVVRGYRTEIQREIGLTFDILDGKKPHIEHLLSLFPFKGADTRCVVSIDATAVKCNFGVQANGKVLGTVKPMVLSKADTVKMTTNLDDFENLRAEQSTKIAKAVFLVLINPVAIDEEDFPIAIFPYHQGQTDDVIMKKLIKLNGKLKDLGVNVVGNGFDGDPKFTRYATSLCNKMMTLAASDMTATITQVFSDVLKDAEITPFFDPNHQVKSDRYRRTLPNEVCVFFDIPPTLRREDFRDVLGLPKSVISDSEMHKMDDSLPRMLFNVQNLLKSLQEGRIDMFIALFPSAALLTAVMEEKLTREERVNLLLCGWAVMFLYYVSMVKYKPDSCESPTLKKDGNRPISLWHVDHVKRYLSSIVCIVKVLLDGKSVNLGALGSHHNENYFGRVKRLQGYDESLERFMKSVEKALLMKNLFKELNVPLCPAGRNSMSGAKIPAGDIPELPPIGYFLFLAKSLLEFITAYDVPELARAIEAFRQANNIEPWETAEDALVLLPNSLVSEPSGKGPLYSGGLTLRKIRSVNTSGGLCKERFISASQINP